MKIWHDFLNWRARKRHERHIRWLRKMRVIINRPPHVSCERNKPGCI